jgi:hypothetical protein
MSLTVGRDVDFLELFDPGMFIQVFREMSGDSLATQTVFT